MGESKMWREPMPTWRKAQKQHQCQGDGCGKVIAKGERYLDRALRIPNKHLRYCEKCGEPIFARANHFFNGPSYQQSIGSAQWRSLRRKVIELRGNRCQHCGQEGASMHLHHLHYRSLGSEQLEDVELLCVKCHMKADLARAWKGRPAKMKTKFALVEGERREAQPGLSGKCPNCDDAMIAKCGQQKVWHWAHRGTRTCDHWWEPETEWHRAWKNHFPKEYQEIIHHSADGEKHIADVRTEHGFIEFQHSHLRREERESREMFYQKLIWIVDGLRRRRDRVQFSAALEAAGMSVVCREPLILLVRWKEGALLRDWGESRVPVYFDFGTDILWRLNPSGPHGMAYVMRVPKAEFLRIHHEGEPFEEMWTKNVELAATQYLMRQASPQPLAGFERYMARRQRTRPRF